jgi:hypothetical protein
LRPVRARARRAERFADQIVEIADTPAFLAAERRPPGRASYSNRPLEELRSTGHVGAASGEIEVDAALEHLFALGLIEMVLSSTGEESYRITPGPSLRISATNLELAQQVKT